MFAYDEQHSNTLATPQTTLQTVWQLHVKNATQINLNLIKYQHSGNHPENPSNTLATTYQHAGKNSEHPRNILVTTCKKVLHLNLIECN